MSEILPIKYERQNQLYREKRRIFLLIHYFTDIGVHAPFLCISLNIGKETTKDVKSNRVNAGDTVL